MLIVSTTRTILIPRAVRMSMAPLARAAVGSAKRGYADGDTGSYTRHDGSSDSFNKREKAIEDLYVRQQQAQQLKKLKDQLQSLKKQSDTLEKELNKIEE